MRVSSAIKLKTRIDDNALIEAYQNVRSTRWTSGLSQ